VFERIRKMKRLRDPIKETQKKNNRVCKNAKGRLCWK
jgi:hypothetical protein